MTGHPPIQIGTDTWIIMREYATQPKAIVHRITTTSGDPRFFLMTWEPTAAERRLVSVHTTIQDADKAVPWPRTRPKVPGMPAYAKQSNPQEQSAQAHPPVMGSPHTPATSH